MKNKLGSNYILEKYGLTMRFVNESDAQFILDLRTDEKLSRYLHSTSPNIEMQKNWIKEYKKRECIGVDYYFIFLKDNVKQGVNRIYNIHDDVFTTGSWIFAPYASFESSILASIMTREIAFDTLGLVFEDAFDGCHVDNKQVLKFNKLMGLQNGSHFIDEKGEYIKQSLTKEDFIKNKTKLLKLLGY